MRAAVFAVTRSGVLLAERIRGFWPGQAAVYVQRKWSGPGRIPYDRLEQAVQYAFARYDALVFVMAAGIVVRMIAPYIHDKLQDPAVLVLDDQARHVISLLSGHMGGANLLAQQLAAFLDADPVITTATDVHGCLAVDRVAAELGLRPWPHSHIRCINSGILEHRPVSWQIDPKMSRAQFFQRALHERRLESVGMQPGICQADALTVVLTDRRLPERPSTLFLLPRRLIAGIGCRRGTTMLAIQQALADACARIGQELPAVCQLASAWVKADEPGLLEMAHTLGIPLQFFPRQIMQEKIAFYHLSESVFVQRTIGIGNVCEAAALCAVQHGRIALEKTKFGKVTVALVWEWEN